MTPHVGHQLPGPPAPPWESTQRLGHEHSQQLSSHSPHTGNPDVPQSHQAIHLRECCWGTRGPSPATCTRMQGRTRTLQERSQSPEVTPCIFAHLCTFRERQWRAQGGEWSRSPKVRSWASCPACGVTGLRAADKKAGRVEFYCIYGFCFFN